MSSRVKLVHAYRAILRELYKAVRIFEILLTPFLTITSQLAQGLHEVGLQL